MDANLVQVFDDYLTGRDRAANTLNGYRRDLRLFGRWFESVNGEALQADNLTPTDVRLYRQYLQEAKARPATINRRLACLRSFGAALQAAGLIDQNPVKDIRMAKEQRTAPKWLDKREQAVLTRQLEREVMAARTEPAKRQAIREQAAALLLLHTGLRVGELCALELGDIHLRERTGALQVRNGKGGKARRIPLNREARRALRSWLSVRPEGGGRLLTGKRGDDLSASGFQRRLAAIGKRAGVKTTPHILRHTFAKNLIDAHVTLQEVADLLGHERLDTTRLYVTPSQADLENAVKRLEL